GGLPGLTTRIASMQLHDNNVCDGIAEPTITFADPNLGGLANMSTNDVLDVANALASALERLQAAGRISLPFTDKQLRDALDLVDKFRAIANDPAAAANTSLQTLVGKVEEALSLPMGSLNLRYDAPSHRFLFDLDLNASKSATMPVDLGALS